VFALGPSRGDAQADLSYSGSLSVSLDLAGSEQRALTLSFLDPSAIGDIDLLHLELRRDTATVFDATFSNTADALAALDDAVVPLLYVLQPGAPSELELRFNVSLAAGSVTPGFAFDLAFLSSPVPSRVRRCRAGRRVRLAHDPPLGVGALAPLPHPALEHQHGRLARLDPAEREVAEHEGRDAGHVLLGGEPGADLELVARAGQRARGELDAEVPRDCRDRARIISRRSSNAPRRPARDASVGGPRARAPPRSRRASRPDSERLDVDPVLGATRRRWRAAPVDLDPARPAEQVGQSAAPVEGNPGSRGPSAIAPNPGVRRSRASTRSRSRPGR
jgi:hypothetical protein